MKEFVEKLIGRLEEESDFFSGEPMGSLQKAYYCKGVEKAISIVNQLAEEYNNDFCEWEYDGTMYDRCPHTETLFARIHNCDEKIFKFCPYCGKKIKIAPYQPKGE